MFNFSRLSLLSVLPLIFAHFVLLELPYGSWSARTVNIHIGRRLSGKSHDEILQKVLKKFSARLIVAVQQFSETIRVTFGTGNSAIEVLKSTGVRLFGIWCRMDGGPPPP